MIQFPLCGCMAAVPIPKWYTGSAKRVVLPLILATSTALTGCNASGPADVHPADSIADALDLGDAITFHTEGGPTDEGAPIDGTLTLTETVRRVAQTHPSIQAALARVRIGLADAQQARLLPNPVLNLAMRWPQAGGTPIVEASLAQDLISILQMPRKTSAADHRLRQAAADVVTVALDVVAQTQECYTTIQALEQQLPVLEERRDLLAKLVDLAKSRLDAGEGIRQDIVTLEARRVELDVELAATELERRDERLRLARLIGEPSSDASWPLEQWNMPDALQGTETSWIESALTHRPEVQSIAWELAAIGDDLALTSLLQFDGASAGVTAERDNTWSIGPAVAVPLPDFDMGQARTSRATAQQVEARHRLTLAKRLIVEEVRRAFQSLAQTRHNQARVRNELVPLHEQRRSLAESAFQLGHADATDFILAEHDLRAAQVHAIQLEQQTAITQIRLHRAVGGSGVARQIAAPISSTNPIQNHRTHNNQSAAKDR